MNPYWKSAHEVHRRQAKGAVPYCIIKSYSGRADYDDGNIDIVVDIPLQEAFTSMYADAFFVTPKDKVKARFYERNKLMLTPHESDLAKIHLHSNAGWHDICFVDSTRILAAAVTAPIHDYPVTYLPRELEARICLLHCFFENFAVSPDDARFLHTSDYVSLLQELGLPTKFIDSILEINGEIPISVLSKIWRPYYNSKKNVSLWNRFLHWLLVAIQLKRRRNTKRV